MCNVFVSNAGKNFKKRQDTGIVVLILSKDKNIFQKSTWRMIKESMFKRKRLRPELHSMFIRICNKVPDKVILESL